MVSQNGYASGAAAPQLPPEYVQNWINAAGAVDPYGAAQVANSAWQFGAGLQYDAAQANQQAEQQAAQFNASNRLAVEQANAANALQAEEANQAARLRVAETNASLRAQQAQLAEQIRQADLADARERENMRFLLRKEQVATEEGNRAALQNAVALQEQISARIESNRLQRQQLTTDVNSLNAQIENNVRQFNAQEAARVEQLNEERRQANLRQLQDVSTQIGELAQNPADVGKLAAFLRSGRPDAISSAVARGEDAITDESLLGLRGLLGVRGELQQGPEQATGNFITGERVAAPQFDTPLGTAPEVDQLFQPIAFDPSGIARGPGAAAPDLGQYYQPIGVPPEVQAPVIGQPPQVQAEVLRTAGYAPGASPPLTAGEIRSGPGFQPREQPPTLDDIGGYTPKRLEDVQGLTPQQREANKAFADARTGFVVRDGETTTEKVPAVGINDIQQQIPDAQIVQQYEELPDFVRRALAFEAGGVAPPGMPVIVGDSSDGKENQELAMVDAYGNLVVHPLDELPRAETGGVFDPGWGSDAGKSIADRFAALQAPAQRTGGPITGEMRPVAADMTPARWPGRSAGSAGRAGSEKRYDLGTVEGINAARADPNFVPYVSSGAGIAELRGTYDPTAAYTQAFAPVPPDLRDRYFEQLLGGASGTPAGTTAPRGGLVRGPGTMAPLDEARPAVQPAVISQGEMQAWAQARQASQAGAGQIGPVSPEVARLFLSDVQRDALRRGGFSDPTQVSPLKVSAPGTSRFLQDLSASVAGTLGYGPSSAFFEELQRLRPTSVYGGTARRTA